MIKYLATIGVVILAWVLGVIICATMDEFFKDHTEIVILAFTVGFVIALLAGIMIF